MMKFIHVTIILLIFLPGCKKKIEENVVDIKRIEIDGSTNDRYQFREEIEKEKRLKNKYKKDDF